MMSVEQTSVTVEQWKLHPILTVNPYLRTSHGRTHRRFDQQRKPRLGYFVRYRRLEIPLGPH